MRFCVTRWCHLCPGVAEYLLLKARPIHCGTSLTGVRAECSSTFSVVLSTWKMERYVTTHQALFVISFVLAFSVLVNYIYWIIVAFCFKLIFYRLGLFEFDSVLVCLIMCATNFGICDCIILHWKRKGLEINLQPGIHDTNVM